MPPNTSIPKFGADEIRRVNSLIERKLEGNGKLAVAYPFPTDAFLFLLYREAFGNDQGNGPKQMTEEEAAVPIKVGNTVTTRGTARRASLNVLNLLAISMTQSPDQKGEVDQTETEQKLFRWLKDTTPAANPPFTPAISASSPSAIQSPRSKLVSNLQAHLPMEAKAKPTEQVVHMNQPRSLHPVSQPPSVVAFQPQPTQQTNPIIINTQAVPPTVPAAAPSYHPFPYATGWNHNPHYGQAIQAFPPHAQAPLPIHAYGPWVYPMPAVLPQYYGAMPPMAPPQYAYPHAVPLVGQPIFVPNSVLRTSEGAPPPTTPVPSRLTLPPADRQATSSTWAVPKSFNIAEWAQENRPPTPPTTSATRTVQSLPFSSNVPPTIRYNYGSARMYPVTTKGAISSKLKKLTRKGTPTFRQASEPSSFPFEDGISGSPASWGVVQIANIPYGMLRLELFDFLGPNPRILSTDLGWPIHIILDRLTGKTMDCYVEFLSVENAQAFVNDCNRPSYLNKLGDRLVTVTMSNQDALLEQIFARATNVEWRGGMPIIKESQDPFNTGFKGFLSSEELVRLIQHAEFPHRSGYTSKNLQRPYECMISILYKFPWYAANTYTIGQRNQIFAAANDLIRILLTHINRKTDMYLHQTLLEELLYAGLNAAGFSDKQRWQLCKTAEQVGQAIRLSPLAKDWPFEVLTRKLDVPEDLMNYYVDRLTKHLDRRGVRPTLNPFRTFLLPPTKGDRFAVKAKEQGELELKCVLDIYRMTLPKEEEKKEEAPGPSSGQGQ